MIRHSSLRHASFIVLFAVASATPALQGCSASGSSSSSSGRAEPSETENSTSDGGAGSRDSGSMDAARGDILVVTFDGASVAGSVKTCGYTQDSTYRTMECALDLANGNTVRIRYLAAAGSGFAPTGSVNVPRQDSVLVTVQMMETGKTEYATEEDVPWSAKGTLNLTATGEGGHWAGTAEGTFSRNNPFSSKPIPNPIAFKIAWDKKS